MMGYCEKHGEQEFIVINESKSYCSVCAEEKNAAAEKYVAKGFDESYADSDGRICVKCSACNAAVVNRVPVHEHGCPNIAR